MDIEVLAQRWIEDTDREVTDSAALREVSDITLDQDHAKLWRFINCAIAEDISNLALANLAAGPLENLLAYFGAEYIEKVEEQSRRNPAFRHLLGGVWRSSMPKEIWDRVTAARGEAW